MYTVVRELPPGSTPCARAKSAADFEPGCTQRLVRVSTRGDLTLEAITHSPSRRDRRARVARGHVIAGQAGRTASAEISISAPSPGKPLTITPGAGGTRPR